MVRVQLPAVAPILYRLRVSTRPSLQNSTHSGQHGGSLPFLFWGRGRQAMHLLCKQVDVGALPTDSTNFNCGKLDRCTERSLINFFRWVAGATPATLTISDGWQSSNAPVPKTE